MVKVLWLDFKFSEEVREKIQPFRENALTIFPWRGKVNGYLASVRVRTQSVTIRQNMMFVEA